MDEINKKLKKQVVFTANDPRFDIKKIPTGILSLDMMLGGGIARGRWTEIYGDWGGLKTTVSLQLCSNAQRLGLPVLYIDNERTITQEFLIHNNVDLDPSMFNLVVPDLAEEVVDILEVYLRDGNFKVVILDSIAAMLPRKEAEKAADQDSMGLAGKLTSGMTRKLTALNDDTALIMINQTRDSLSNTFFRGTPKVTPGGRALGFYTAQRIEVTRAMAEKKEIQGKKKTVGRNVIFNLKKDKTGGQEEQSCELYYDFASKSIDKGRDLFNNLLQLGWLKKCGATYQLASQTFRGKPAVVATLNKPKIYRRLTEKVMEKVNG